MKKSTKKLEKLQFKNGGDFHDDNAYEEKAEKMGT